jgi:transposase InsO family protein
MVGPLSLSDQSIDGRRLRILVVVDDCTRECLALVADTSISGIRVARELDRLLDERGKPKTIVNDNGTELTSNAILQWADDHKINWLCVPKTQTWRWVGAPRDRSPTCVRERDKAALLQSSTSWPFTPGLMVSALDVLGAQNNARSKNGRSLADL